MDDETYSARGTDAPWYRGWSHLTDIARDAFRQTTLASQAAKKRALSGECSHPKHPICVPRLDPADLMPQSPANGLTALSLFSGGGGMDIGFERAGFRHEASYELLPSAAAVLKTARPDWTVYGGAAGDVTKADWLPYHDRIDVLHGGPPCQPFSLAGRQNGPDDARDMIPSLMSAVAATRPRAFVCENVAGLAAKRFADYVDDNIHRPLSGTYTIQSFQLDAADFGVPQKRRRVFFVGFRDKWAAGRFKPPARTHIAVPDSSDMLEQHSALPRTMGARQALGLSDIGYDSLAPTLRSGLTGPRHTTSILSSVTALRSWNALRIWPNGVAIDREHARAYVAKSGDYRLSVPDCMILQGFPIDWPLTRPVYLALGLIGNSVAPPMAYRLALAIGAALKQSTL